MTSLARRPRSSAVAPPLEDDDLLSEILLRLSPQPYSLPRASLVCQRWRRLVSEPYFCRRFRLHHRHNPPLLGFFDTSRGISFQPTLDAPNRVPPGRFSLQLDGDGFRLLNSRHGLLLFHYQKRKQVLLWDPLTGNHHSFAIPTTTGFDMKRTPIQGAVLRAAGEVHHFQVILAVADEEDRLNRRVLACVYSSETGVWGNPISTPLPYKAFRDIHPTNVCMPAVLVGDSLYWLLTANCGISSCILEFNLQNQGLAVIELPVDMSEDDTDLTAMCAEGGGLGFLFVSSSDLSAQLWKRKTDCDGVASWVLGTTVQLDKLLSLNSVEARDFIFILVFLWTGIGPFMVELESLQFKKLAETNNLCHPFESVYAIPAISKQLIL